MIGTHILVLKRENASLDMGEKKYIDSHVSAFFPEIRVPVDVKRLLAQDRFLSGNVLEIVIIYTLPLFGSGKIEVRDLDTLKSYAKEICNDITDKPTQVRLSAPFDEPSPYSSENGTSIITQSLGLTDYQVLSEITLKRFTVKSKNKDSQEK